MGIEFMIVALIAFMLIASLIAVETRDLLSSVIALGAAGFALSVIDLLMGAPDLAITQVVVEVIALVLLIRVVVTRKDTTVETPRDALRTGAALLAGGLLLVGVFFAVGGAGGEGVVPPFGEPLLSHDANDPRPPGVSRQYLGDPEQLREFAAGDRPANRVTRGGALRETGATNAVMAVLLDYRAYDTLGEATVIFASIIGAYAILRHVGRRKQEALP